MEIRLIISADESALEFSRNLGAMFLNSEEFKNSFTEAVKTEVKTETKKEEVKTDVKTDVNKSITIEQIRAKASEMLQSDPKRLAKAIQHFGIERVPDLKPEQYEDFMEYING